MANPLKVARKDAAFQKALRMIKEVPEVPEWPLPSVSPEQWAALPYRVRHNLNTIIGQFVSMSKEAH